MSHCFKVNLKSPNRKFIVWVLFTFPEGPGILELVHFIGSVIAGKEQGRTALS